MEKKEDFCLIAVGNGNRFFRLQSAYKRQFNEVYSITGKKEIVITKKASNRDLNPIFPEHWKIINETQVFGKCRGRHQHYL